MKKPLTFTIHLNGVQVDRIPDDIAQRMADRIGDAMSRYYTAHPDEYQRIKGGSQNEKSA